MDVFDLAAKLTLDSSAYDQGLAGAESKASGFGSKLKTGLGNAGKIVTGTIAAVGVATAATTTAMVKATGEVAQYGDNIDKMSQKMGISAEAYQEWEAVMQHSGTSMETLKAGMKTLANAVENGNEAFERLGITQEEIAGMSNEELFNSTITALQNVENETERTYLAGQLLGRGATELGALLNTSAEDTQAMKDRLHELGGVMSDEAVKAAATYQDTLQDMQTGFEGLKRNLVSEFLPGITGVMDGLTSLTTGDYDMGESKISAGIDNVISAITTNLPKFADAGIAIIMALSNSLVDNFPKLAETLFGVIGKLFEKLGANGGEMVSNIGQMLVGLVNIIGQQLPTIIKQLGPVIIAIITSLLTDVIPSLAEAILNSLPQILESVLDLVVMLVEYIATDGIPMLINLVIDLTLKVIELIPQLIVMIVKAIPKLISGIITGILGNLPLFIMAGIQLFVALIQALPEIIIEIVKAVPEIIKGIIDGFKGAWDQIQNSGGDLFGEWIYGFMDFGTKIWDSVKEIWEKLKQAFTDKFNQIKDIGKNLIQGLIDGIKSMIGNVGNAIKGVADKITGGFKSLFGIASPSKLFAEYGKFLDEGLAIGISGNLKPIDNAMNKLYNNVNTTMPAPQLAIAGGSSSGVGGLQIAGTNTVVERLIFPFYLGTEHIQTIVVDATNLAQYESGGR